jgi:hypothetical protein
MKKLSPRLHEWLLLLARTPAPRPKGTIVGPTARRHGFTEDEIELDGRRMGVAEAITLIGKEWFLSTKFTGNERLTPKGLAALERQK